MSCHCHTEITRDGSGQLDRYLKALDPSYAPIDDRSIEELLVFAKRYASQIRFYDLPDSASDQAVPAHKVSWREFFRRDMAVVAASVSTSDFTQVKKDYDETREKLNENPDAEIYAALFKPILGIAAKIDSWYSVAIPENPLYNDLTLAIQSSLKAQLKKVRDYEEGFKVVDAASPLNLDYDSIKNKKLWGLNDPVQADVSIYQGTDERKNIYNAALYVDDIFLAFYGFVTNLVSYSDRYLTFALETYPAHQPHMSLFIAFLKLFRHAQDQMNGITQRMLDYYYRDVLQLREKPSVADRVHVVFELAKDVSDYNLSQGTSLLAGKDASGKELRYETEADLVINQAKVKELKTIFIEKAGAASDEDTLASIYARPIANSQDGYGEAFSTAYPMWPAFGKGANLDREAKNICEQIALLEDRLDYKNDTAIGFAIASPQLVLQGGNRLIAYELDGLNSIFSGSSEVDVGAIQIRFTTERGWLDVNRKLAADEYDQLRSVLTEGFFPTEEIQTGYHFDSSVNVLLVYLPIPEAPIVGFDAEVHDGKFITTFPVMQILLGPSININLDSFNSLKFNRSRLEVRVGSINRGEAFLPNMDGLKTLVLQNDDGVIDASKVFDPFTAYPTGGKSLYIGSDEVFNKAVDELSINILLAADDTNEGISTMASSRQTVFRLNLLKQRKWIPLLNDDSSSFILTRNILRDEHGEVEVLRLPLAYDLQYSIQSVKGFLQLQLNIPYSTYGDNVFESIQRLALMLKVKEISLSYHANLYALEAGVDQFFHVYPFGVLEVDLQNQGFRIQDRLERSSRTSNVIQNLGRTNNDLLVSTDALFPQFTYLNPYAKYDEDQQPDHEHENHYDVRLNNSNELTSERRKARYQDKISRLMLSASGVLEKINGSDNQYSGKLQEEGILYIGIENLKPLQTLSLLFQFAEGTAEDEDNEAPELHWSYLSNNEWRPLNGENIIADDTFGFQTTGIVKLDVPADATNHNTIITDGLHWFCVSVTEHANRIPHLIQVVAQAVIAKFNDQDNDQSHFDEALPAESINKMAVKVAEVSRVSQPFASWDGKPREVDEVFYTRVSERLRHKNRAVTVWDYEHLVLERFSEIYKVKAITHTDPSCLCRHPEEAVQIDNADACCGSQISPGHVLLVPIANLKNRNALNPLQPKTGRRTLLAIQEYIRERTSPFVKVHARNPVYEQVLVFFRVKFYPGVDKGYHLEKLNDEIVEFLTPWAFHAEADVKFGQKIYASAIINFIEERPYVDFITDFVMGVCKEQCCEEEHDEPPYIPDESTPFESEDGRLLVKGVVMDGATLLPLAEGRVIIKDTSIETFTDQDGKFELQNTSNDPVSLILYFEGYQTREIPSPVNTEWKIYLQKEEHNEGENEGVPELLSNLCGCSELEHLIQENPDEHGLTIATPSTPRSILVSAPKHIIVPYVEPDRPDPCEEIRANRVLSPDAGKRDGNREKSTIKKEPNGGSSARLKEEAEKSDKEKKKTTSARKKTTRRKKPDQ